MKGQTIDVLGKDCKQQGDASTDPYIILEAGVVRPKHGVDLQNRNGQPGVWSKDQEILKSRISVQNSRPPILKEGVGRGALYICLTGTKSGSVAMMF